MPAFAFRLGHGVCRRCFRDASDERHQGHLERRRARHGGRLYRLGRAEQGNRGDGDTGLGR